MLLLSSGFGSIGTLNSDCSLFQIWQEFLSYQYMNLLYQNLNMYEVCDDATAQQCLVLMK